MEAKMIANMAPVKPNIPKVLIDATVKAIQDGMRSDDMSGRTGEKSFAVGGEVSSSTGGAKSLKKKKNKDDGRLRKRLQRRAEGDDDDEPTRTYRNFDERRMGFLLIGDQHRLAGTAGGDKFISPSAPPLDYSFCMINKIEEIVTEGEHPQKKRNYRFPKKTPDDRYRTSSLRLSYNVIDTVEGLVNILYKILDGGPFGLCWVDLSFNAITKLEEDTFSQLPNLKILYLHGNAITDMTEVPNLQSLKNLVSLTLHGNPMEEEDGYRDSVLYYLPWLRHLDFVAVTKADMASSAEFGAMYAPYWEKRHDDLETLYQTKKRAGEITFTEKVMQGYEEGEENDDADAVQEQD